jgi:hypothetical protein
MKNSRQQLISKTKSLNIKANKTTQVGKMITIAELILTQTPPISKSLVTHLLVKTSALAG